MKDSQIGALCVVILVTSIRSAAMAFIFLKHWCSRICRPLGSEDQGVVQVKEGAREAAEAGVDRALEEDEEEGIPKNRSPTRMTSGWASLVTLRWRTLIKTKKGSPARPSHDEASH